MVLQNIKKNTGNEIKGKKLMHNLTENRIRIPSINGKTKINNNITTIKKLNFI